MFDQATLNFVTIGMCVLFGGCGTGLGTPPPASCPIEFVEIKACASLAWRTELGVGDPLTADLTLEPKEPSTGSKESLRAQVQQFHLSISAVNCCGKSLEIEPVVQESQAGVFSIHQFLFPEPGIWRVVFELRNRDESVVSRSEVSYELH